jgi:hypothetical protein
MPQMQPAVHQVQQHDDAAMPQMQPAVQQHDAATSSSIACHDAATSSFPICTNLPHQDKNPVATKSAYDSVSLAFISVNTTAKDSRD